jgi:hypothetical protein
VVAPQRAIAVAGNPRLAWWRIDARSGETTAVTDEGLNAAAVEVTIEHNKSQATTTVTVEQTIGPAGQTVTYSYSGGVSEMARDVEVLTRAGFQDGWIVRSVFR